MNDGLHEEYITACSATSVVYEFREESLETLLLIGLRREAAQVASEEKETSMTLYHHKSPIVVEISDEEISPTKSSPSTDVDSSRRTKQHFSLKDIINKGLWRTQLTQWISECDFQSPQMIEKQYKTKLRRQKEKGQEYMKTFKLY
jgi:hypothetical protein